MILHSVEKYFPLLLFFVFSSWDLRDSTYRNSIKRAFMCIYSETSSHIRLWACQPPENQRFFYLISTSYLFRFQWISRYADDSNLMKRNFITFISFLNLVEICSGFLVFLAKTNKIEVYKHSASFFRSEFVLVKLNFWFNLSSSFARSCLTSCECFPSIQLSTLYLETLLYWRQ